MVPAPAANPAAAAPQQGAPAAAAGAPQMPPGLMQDPQAMLRQIVTGINNANPGADPETKFYAVQQAIQMLKGVQPEIKDQMTAFMNEVRLNQGQQRIDQGFARLEQQAAEFNRRQGDIEAQNAVKNSLVDLRKQLIDLQLSGADPKEIQKHKDRLDEIEAQITGRKDIQAGKDARADAKDAVKAARTAGIDQIKEINTQISNIRQKDPTANIDQLTAQRKAISDRLVKQGMDIAAQKKALQQSLKEPEKPAASDVQPADNEAVLQQARDAIAQGAPRDKVIERLKQQGIDPGGL